MEDTNEKTLKETIAAEVSASSNEVVRIDFGNLKKDISNLAESCLKCLDPTI